MKDDMIYVCRMHRDEIEHIRRMKDYENRSRVNPVEIVLMMVTLVAVFAVSAGLVTLTNGAELAESALWMVPGLFWLGVMLAIREEGNE